MEVFNFDSFEVFKFDDLSVIDYKNGIVTIVGNSKENRVMINLTKNDMALFVDGCEVDNLADIFNFDNCERIIELFSKMIKLYNEKFV